MPTMASGMGVWITILLECVKRLLGMIGRMVGVVEGDLNVKQKLLYAIIWIHDLGPRRQCCYSIGQE